MQSTGVIFHDPVCKVDIKVTHILPQAVYDVFNAIEAPVLAKRQAI